MNRFSVPPLSDVTRTLAAVASGRAPPDLVIRDARVLCTYTERVLEGREIWIASGRIAAVKPAGTFRGDGATTIHDAEGGLIAPGLVDPHVHVESSMMTVCAFAEAALLNGTTTIFCDSHEIGNVCDAAGIEWMLEDARAAPLNVFLTVPSTVPATSPLIETAGGDLTPAKIGAIFDRWPEAAALGEKMDFVPVCAGDERSHAIIAEALRRGRPVSGHVYGREFVAAYAASGVTDTHEAIDGAIARDLLEAGVWIFLRGGNPATPWNSLPEAIRAITEMGCDTKRVAVCTDDRDADDLFAFGMDWVVREAVTCGLPATRAWSLGSLHGATRYGMDGELGGLGGGRRADLVLLDDGFRPQSTWYGGERVVDRRRITEALEAQLATARYRYPDAAYRTVTLPASPSLVPALPAAEVAANVLRIEQPGIVVRHDRVALAPAATWDALLDEHGLCFVTVVERHGRGGHVAHGLLRGFGLTRGAVASTVGHDAHNIIVTGRVEADMQVALAAVAAGGGGVAVVEEGKVTARVALPVAGLLSDRRAPEVAAEMEALKRAWAVLGLLLPFMGFNLIPLSVIPELRITDKGLVTVPGMEQLPLFEAA